MDNTFSADLEQRLAELQAIFHAQLPGKIDEINTTWQALYREWSAENLARLQRLSHSLAGSGGTFGAHEVGQAARNLEQPLKALAAENPRPPDAETRQQLQSLLDALARTASQWQPQQAPAAAHGEEEAPLPPNTRGDLIYLVDDDPLVAQQYQEVLNSVGYQVERFSSTEAFSAACHHILPSVIIMDMVFAEGSNAGAEMREKLAHSGQGCPNIIFTSQRNDIEARLAALRAGARHYLHKPVEPRQLLQRVDQLSGRHDAAPYRVLIVDDDAPLAQYHSEILECHGIETRIINNPMMTLQVIEEYQPELLLLDLYMEECDGTELAAVLRQDDKMAQMPIVFLSEELDFDHQIAAQQLGGDDFITKPVNPENLIAMLSARLTRSRRINELNQQLLRTMRELEFQQLALDKHSIVSSADTSGNITYVNDKFCEISQYSREELMYENHRIVKSDYHPKSFFDEMWATITAGKVWHGVVQNRAKDGSRYWVDSTIVPFLDKQGLPYKYISIRTDITPVIEVQRAMEVARDEAEEASRAKSRFLSSMSHELRTPMNAILGFAQLLEMEPLGAEQRHWVKDILKGGNHLLDLINATLDLAKIESGQIDLSLEPVEISEVLDEATTILQPLFESRAIHYSSSDCEQQLIKGDRTRIKQVVINLLSNATKYNREGGTIRIHCSPSQHAQMLRLSISDSGKGIAAERIPELFEPFNRLDAEGGNTEGSGIGLTISKDLVEMMGGRIGVDSEPGHGSTFWFELPITQQPGSSSTGGESQDSTPIAGHDQLFNLLYIEDNPVNLRLVSMVMSKQPHIRLHTAHEPVLGLEMARSEIPDLILLDINLPGMDGYEVLSRLRSDSNTAHIPVFAVTANALEEDRKKGQQRGFDNYIIKPINIKHFIQAINERLFQP